jgi:gluconokinase
VQRTIVVMGVSGVGKTTVGTALARALGCAFLDADDLHPPANIEKMRKGQPLTDEDRAPWLAALADRIASSAEPLVIACSALRASHRQSMGDVTFVFLDAPDEVIAERLARRSGHFAKPELLPSQRATLERPDGALVINAALPVETQVTTITSALRTRSSSP